jgi:hypothetical protein
MDSGDTEWVHYHPPKSVSFGHQPRLRDPRKAWAAVQRFLRELTAFELLPRIELTCYGPGRDISPATAMERIRQARNLFGPEEDRTRADPRWKISDDKIDAAVAFALDNDKFPKAMMGPAWLHFSYGFLWNEFERLPYQLVGNEHRYYHRMSHLMVFIGGHKGMFLQPAFLFPAPWNSEVLRDFLNRIESLTPFRFRDQYFSRSLADGGGGRVLKLDKNWRRPVISLAHCG